MNYRLLAVLSGIFLALNIIADGYNLHVLFPNFYNYAVLGAWTGVILTVLITILFGRHFDNKFTSIGKLPRKSIKYAIIAGIAGSIYTLLYIYFLQKYDPSFIAATIPLTLVFLMVRDSISSREKLTLIEITSIIMVCIGAILVSFNGGKFDIIALLLAGVLLNIINALYSHFMKIGMNSGADAFNFRLLITLVLAVAFTFYSYPHLDFSSVKLSSILYVTGSMLFAFLGYICYLSALKEGKVSIVSSLNFAYIPIVFILTFLLSLIEPAIFSIELTGTLWLMKLFGIILVLMGILSIVLGEFSSFLFIKCEPKMYKDIRNKLLSLSETRALYELFGNYGLVVKINVKSSGKLQNTISEKIKPIKGILQVDEAMILKEQGT